MNAIAVPLSAGYIALAGLLLLALTLNVIRHRWRAGVGLGDGGDKALLRAIRAHGNAAENLPIQLLLLLALELCGVAAPLIHGFGAAILASRLLHAVGLSRRSGSSPGRMAGMGLGLLLSLLMSLGLLAAALGFI